MKNDFLSLPSDQRHQLAGEWEERTPQKAEIEPGQIPLPFGEEEYVKPVARCNFCPFVKGDIKHGEIIRLKLYGCPDCGSKLSIIDLWE